MDTFNFSTLTTNPQTLTNIPDYNQIHEVMVVDHNSGEILCTIQYNWIKWDPVQTIFEKYQKTRKPFDIYWDNIQTFQLFRIYQQKQNGVWVKRPYTPHPPENGKDELSELNRILDEMKIQVESLAETFNAFKTKFPQYIKGTPEYERRMSQTEDFEKINGEWVYKGGK